MVCKFGEQVQRQEPWAGPVVAKANPADESGVRTVHWIERPGEGAIGRLRLASPDQILRLLDLAESEMGDRADGEYIA